ncbi:MAG: CHAT domain-containing protein, partial [Planctomycetota bacterium]
VTQLLELQLKKKLTQNNAANFTQSLADALRDLKRDRDAWTVLMAGTEEFSFLDNPSSNLSVQNVASLMLTTLRLRMDQHREIASLVERFIVWSRQQLDRHRVSTINRIQLLQNIRLLRSEAIEMADRVSGELVKENKLEESAEWRKRALRWDAELGQRVLLERILEPHQIPVGSDAIGLWEGPIWPMREELRPTWQNAHRPKLYEDLVSANCALDASQQPSGGTLDVKLQQVSHEVASRWRQTIDAQVQISDLARILGEGSLLLRCNLGSDGKIHWSAFASDGRELEMLCHDSGEGTTDSRQRIETALALHESQISFGYLDSKQREGLRRLVEDTDFEVFCSPEEMDKAIVDKLNAFCMQVAVVAGASALKSTANALARLLRTLRSQDQMAQFQQHWELMQQTWLKSLEVDSCSEAINAATSRLLRELEEVWNLDALAEHLSPEQDLVILADDTLGSLPIAMMQCGKQPLFRQVRSVRSSLSLMLDQFAAMAEADATTSTQAPLSAVSWFGEDDPARVGAAELHHGIIHLADQHERSIATAADNPLGTVHHVRTACANDDGLSVLVTYGHGSVEQSGIALGPDGTLFQGQGCQLAQVEFPQFISCSVGRNSDSGAHDFEGLSCELARVGARSALVAVWPIHSLQAAHFSNEVTHQYLKLREQHPVPSCELTKERLRGLAVNLAREVLLEELDEAGNPKYLNTIAAFSLLGLA